VAELGVQPPTGLYPQPTQQQGGLSSNPAQVLDLIRGITQNEILQKELRARNAAGQVYQGALNPDLTLDPAKFRAGLKDNPDVMFNAPQVVQGAQTLIGSQTDNATRYRQILAQTVGALPPGASNEDIFNAITTATRMGVPSQYTLPVQNSILNSRNRSAAIGIVRSGGMSPGEQSTLTETVDPATGATYKVPMSSANAGAGLPQTLSPDQQQSVQKFGTDKVVAGQFAQRSLPLQEAMRAINDADARTPGIFGPGSEGRQNFKAFWQTVYPPIAKALGVDEKELADYAKAKKYLTQSVQTRNQQLGGHSDQQLATTISGNPNVEVTDLALPDLVRTSLAAQRAEQAQMHEGFKSGGPQYTESLSQWPKRNDVRAFAIDLMPPADRAKLIKSLTPAEKTRFNNSLRSAYESGVIDRPGKSQ
jgi:hypothetical protein